MAVLDSRRADAGVGDQSPTFPADPGYRAGAPARPPTRFLTRCGDRRQARPPSSAPVPAGGSGEACMSRLGVCIFKITTNERNFVKQEK